MIQEQLYTVIDVETTGKGIRGNRITEICVVQLQGSKVLEKFTSLVNPEAIIPPFITGLTGIDDAMVRDAPKFHEIAEELLRITEGAVFVAHNVNFDYNVLRGEFKRLGINFVRKKLCTVRLSRKLIPGLFSYSLGKLCASLGIPLLDRHRAEGDTDATVLLFRHILELDQGLKTIHSFLNVRSKQATLPPHLKTEQIDSLPEATGVYFFKDQQGKVIYVGKAKNIKQRVLGHFYDLKNSEFELRQNTYTINVERTGSELIALLLEAEHIQTYFPKFNRAQKKRILPYQIIHYTNRRGIIQLAVDRTKNTEQALEVFNTRTAAITKLEQLCVDHQLCPRYCNLQQTTHQCSHYQIKNCKGICHQKESVAIYNIRVKQAMESLEQQQENYLIKEAGRTPDEGSIVLIQKGIYKGFGFIPKSEQLTRFEEFLTFVISKTHTYHTAQILKSYLKKKGHKNVVQF